MATTATAAPAKPAVKSIKGTLTEKNLVKAYVSESGAYTRYIYYSQQAEKEGYFPIQKVFEETAANELRHGKVFMKFLESGVVPCTVDVDAYNIGDTASCLEISIKEEREEGFEEYLASAKVAREEGFIEIAEHFEAIAAIEMHHMKRFQAYLDQVKAGTVWKRDHEITWKCLVCGSEYVGKEPPVVCPACDHPQQHYIAMDMLKF